MRTRWPCAEFVTVVSLLSATGALACASTSGEGDAQTAEEDDGQGSGGSGVGNGATDSDGDGPGAGPPSGSGETESDGGTSTHEGSCAWPAGPFGIDEGQTLPSDLEWEGFRPHSDEPTTLRIRDYFDCDGTRSIHAAYFITAKWGCPWSAKDAAALGPQVASWADRGIVVVFLILNDEGPEEWAMPTLGGVLEWRTKYSLEAAHVVADPDFSLVPGDVGDPFYTPQKTLVDPRTMVVVDLRDGFSEDHTYVFEFAEQNANP